MVCRQACAKTNRRATIDVYGSLIAGGAKHDLSASPKIANRDSPWPVRSWRGVIKSRRYSFGRAAPVAIGRRSHFKNQFPAAGDVGVTEQIGRASCRERV